MMKSTSYIKVMSEARSYDKFMSHSDIISAIKYQSSDRDIGADLNDWIQRSIEITRHDFMMLAQKERV